jgi:hypothetical protein
MPRGATCSTMRVGCVNEFMQLAGTGAQTAEQVTSMHHARLTLTDDDQSGGLVQCLNPSGRCGRCRLQCST